MCPAAESCYVCGPSGLPHIEHIPVSVLSCPCRRAYGQVCVCTLPSLLLSCHSPQGFIAKSSPESHKEPLLNAGSKAVPGWLQPRHVPPALISRERIKCHFLGTGRGCVRPERQQQKRGGGEGGNRQRNWTTFLGASKHVVCLGSRQSLFGGCIVSCGNWLRPKPSPGSSSCTFCSKLLRMDPN